MMSLILCRHAGCVCNIWSVVVEYISLLVAVSHWGNQCSLHFQRNATAVVRFQHVRTSGVMLWSVADCAIVCRTKSLGNVAEDKSGFIGFVTQIILLLSDILHHKWAYMRNLNTMLPTARHCHTQHDTQTTIKTRSHRDCRQQCAAVYSRR